MAGASDPVPPWQLENLEESQYYEAVFVPKLMLCRICTGSPAETVVLLPA